MSGPVLVIDGDGFKIGEHEIRVFGIDAPEMRGGPEGRKARGVMEDLIADQQVTCNVLNLDRYDRLISTCKVACVLTAGWMPTHPAIILQLCTPAAVPPSGFDWVHELKHHGHRITAAAARALRHLESTPVLRRLST